MADGLRGALQPEGHKRDRRGQRLCAEEDTTGSSHAHTLSCKTQINAVFKLKAIELAFKKGNRATTNQLGINRSQREEFSQHKKMTKPFRGHKDTEEDNFSEFSMQEEDQGSD